MKFGTSQFFSNLLKNLKKKKILDPDNKKKNFFEKVILKVN